MPITLDANDPTQVASASHIEFQTGEPGQKSVILSGIAIPSWNIKDGDKLHQATVTVNLRYPVLAIKQATITLGLASLYSGGTTFLYASDSATLCVDESSQELLLQVDVALMGDPAHLSRFGYQVVVIATTQTTGISGTIRFTTDFFNPSQLSPDEISRLFLVSANSATFLAPPAGGPFGETVYTQIVGGTITGMNVSNGNVGVTYQISAVPYNEDIYVIVTPGQPFTAQTENFDQSAGPYPVHLTAASPSVTGVDFLNGHVIVK